MSRAVVIGAVNMDICGRAYESLVMRDSNPGAVTLTPGGVGRNIAQNLRMLGLEVTFITALGQDAYAGALLDSCKRLGFDMSLARSIPGGRTSSYLYIADPSGDMALAVCDTDVSEALDVRYLETCRSAMNSADAVIVDGNLTQESLDFIGKNCIAPLFADPVSVAKSDRLRPILPRLSAFKPNELEAAHLTGCPDPEKAAGALLDMGMERVFVSLGANGVIAAERGGELIRLPCCPAQIVNTTGAGDAATAAIVWAEINGLSLAESAKAAMRAGALAVSCEGANSPELSPRRLL